MQTEADAIIVTLDGEPKGKGRPRFVRATGHAFTPSATRRFESALRYAAQEAMTGRLPLQGPLVVKVIATFPIAQSWSRKKQAAARSGALRPASLPDADNLLKALDAFNEIVWRDDRQIVDARIEKHYGDKPSLRVEVSPWLEACA